MYSVGPGITADGSQKLGGTIVLFGTGVSVTSGVGVVVARFLKSVSKKADFLAMNIPGPTTGTEGLAANGPGAKGPGANPGINPVTPTGGPNNFRRGVFACEPSGSSEIGASPGYGGGGPTSLVDVSGVGSGDMLLRKFSMSAVDVEEIRLLFLLEKESDES